MREEKAALNEIEWGNAEAVQLITHEHWSAQQDSPLAVDVWTDDGSLISFIESQWPDIPISLTSPEEMSVCVTISWLLDVWIMELLLNAYAKLWNPSAKIQSNDANTWRACNWPLCNEKIRMINFKKQCVVALG